MGKARQNTLREHLKIEIKRGHLRVGRWSNRIMNRSPAWAAPIVLSSTY